MPDATDAEKKKAHQEDLLDEALDESFPASDPPSPSRPGEQDSAPRRAG